MYEVEGQSSTHNDQISCPEYIHAAGNSMYFVRAAAGYIKEKRKSLWFGMELQSQMEMWWSPRCILLKCPSMHMVSHMRGGSVLTRWLTQLTGRVSFSLLASPAWTIASDGWWWWWWWGGDVVELSCVYVCMFFIDLTQIVWNCDDIGRETRLLVPVCLVCRWWFFCLSASPNVLSVFLCHCLSVSPQLKVSHLWPAKEMWCFFLMNQNTKNHQDHNLWFVSESDRNYTQWCDNHVVSPAVKSAPTEFPWWMFVWGLTHVKSLSFLLKWRSTIKNENKLNI